jgi:5-methyltetrahydropteroyltriglutamate--homocysteine methyltransferase
VDVVDTGANLVGVSVGLEDIEELEVGLGSLDLRKEDWDAYLKWAVDSFRLSTSGVENDIQVHSHFCYSDFGDIRGA